MLPTQQTVDWNDPKQHIAWGMRNMPMFGGFGAVTNPGILLTWSEHLVRAGFCHTDYLRSLADENGNIHVSRLPRQLIKWQAPFRGPQDSYNNAARWVDMSAPERETPRIVDVREYTIQEQHAVKDMLVETGVVRPEPPKEVLAQVINE